MSGNTLKVISIFSKFLLINNLENLIFQTNVFQSNLT